MKEVDVVNEVLQAYDEWFEMMDPADSMNFLVEQLARRVVIARDEAQQYKMALKRRDLIQETR